MDLPSLNTNNVKTFQVTIKYIGEHLLNIVLNCSAWKHFLKLKVSHRNQCFVFVFTLTLEKLILKKYLLFIYYFIKQKKKLDTLQFGITSVLILYTAVKQQSTQTRKLTWTKNNNFPLHLYKVCTVKQKIPAIINNKLIRN